jgi:hypothetical protein
MRSIVDLVEQAQAGKVIGYTTLGAGTVGHLLVECEEKRHPNPAYSVQPSAPLPFNQVPSPSAGRAFAWGAVVSQIEAGNRLRWGQPRA